MTYVLLLLITAVFGTSAAVILIFIRKLIGYATDHPEPEEDDDESY